MFRERAKEAAFDATVVSAGFVQDGLEPPPRALAVMEARGLSLEGHRSRVVTRELLAEADLVVAMERLHVRNAVADEPAAFAKTFTFEELVRRGAEVGPVGDRTFQEWIAEMGTDREPIQFLGTDPTDDVPDPMGRSKRVFRRTADRLDVLVDGLTDLLTARAD